MENAAEAVRSFLRPLVADLNACDPHWVVYGSAAVALCGYGVEVNDVDVMMSTDGLERFRRLYACWCECAEVPAGSLFRSAMSRFLINGFRLEVCGPLEICRNGRWQKVRIGEVTVLSDGLRHCSADECRRLLRLFGRPKDLLRLQLMSSGQKRM